MKTLFSALFSFIFVSSMATSQTFEVTDKTLTQVSLVLNWVPEPEFGGFYVAQSTGLFEKLNLKVDILPGGAGTPTIQMLAAGKVEFAVTSGSEVAIARSRGVDVVAVYSIFETSPMGIMVHKSRKLKDLADLFSKEGTIALQQGQAYVDFLKKKYDTSKVKFVPYTGGITNFLRDENYSQQGFIFSEPVSAKRQGADPDFFLLASAGYNPYTAVLAVRGDYLKKNEDLVKRMVAATREGWEIYKKFPEEANKRMHELNKAMDLASFSEGSKNQNSLLGDGTMAEARWKEHIQQLLDAKTISKSVDAKDCFRNF